MSARFFPLSSFLKLLGFILCLNNASLSYADQIPGLSNNNNYPVIELPDLGNPSSQTLSLAEEQALGVQFMQIVWQMLPVNTDPIVESYIQNLGQRLVAHSPSHGRQFAFFVIDDNSINAFAGPGGYIGVHSGLILMAKNESELAAVMAHEIAHVSQRHVARGIEKSNSVRLSTLAGLLGSLLVGSQSPELGAGALAATLSSAQRSMLNFSRNNEQEADRIGMDSLERSGFDANSMATFFDTLGRNTYQDPSIPEFLQTHPLSQKRLSDALNHSARYKTKNLPDNLNFLLIQARLRVTITRDPRKSLAYYNDRLKDSKDLQFTANQYGYALALHKNFKAELAINLLETLIKRYPDELIFQLSLIDMWVAEKNYNTALQQLKKLHTLYPNNYAINVEYANSAALANQPKEAIRFYRHAIFQQPTNLQLYADLARAYANNKQLVEAYMTRSKMFALLGNNSRAIGLLQQAKKQPGLTANQLAVIEARLRDLGLKEDKENN